MENQGILSTIKTYTTYTSKILSTGKGFKFRPYTAGEEQGLLLAKESEDVNTIVASVKEVIRSCTFGEVDPDKLSSFDIEWVLLQLRAKAVGEEIEISIPCNHCDKTNDATVNINSIEEPEIIKNYNVVDLGNDLYVVMRPPGFDVLNKLNDPDINIFSLVAGLITQVIAGDKTIDTDQLNPEEVTAFVKSMNSKSIKKLTDFIKDIPSIEHKLNIKCMHCLKDNAYTFKGINNFFV